MESQHRSADDIQRYFAEGKVVMESCPTCGATHYKIIKEDEVDALDPVLGETGTYG